MSKNSMTRLKALVSGRVQGVGFRFFTTKQAEKLSLTGWVRNEPDGRVKIVAEGEQSKLEELLSAVEEGPASARVTNVDAEWETYQEAFQQFAVRH